TAARAGESSRGLASPEPDLGRWPPLGLVTPRRRGGPASRRPSPAPPGSLRSQPAYFRPMRRARSAPTWACSFAPRQVIVALRTTDTAAAWAWVRDLGK